MSKESLTLVLLAASFSTCSSDKAIAQCPTPNGKIDLTLPQPIIEPIDIKSGLLKGKLSDPPKNATPPKDAALQVCVNGDVKSPSEQIMPDKSFVIKPATPLKTGDKVTVQVVAIDNGNYTYGPESKTADYSETRYIFIGGVEQSGYSSLTLSTDPFIQVYIEGPEKKHKFLLYDAWGRIRLLGAPQPSTNGIASTFTDPTGTITKQDFTKVGQSMDIVGGGQLFVNRANPSWGQTSVIAWLGTTTPLSAQNIAYTFKTPAVNTLECQQLLSRFTPATGYNPGLSADPSGKNCVVNGTTAVTDIAFANQDRTNFLFKWGVGFRTQGAVGCKTDRTDCIMALALLDATVGQDATVTRGLVRHFVAKADGLLPIPTGDTSYLYLFGSVYTRFTRNKNSSPLILAAETTQPTLPSATVVVLPLVQPDRDFFRLGIGLNLAQIFKKLFSASTSTTQ